MDPQLLSLAGLGLLLAGVVKGATGLGYASCALPFLVMTFGLKPAMGLILIPAMATNVSVALSTGHVLSTTRRFGVLYAAMLPGIALGLWLLLLVDSRIATALLGSVMIVYAIMALARPAFEIPHRWQQTLQAPTGFLNGVMTGLTGSQVMPLFPYILALRLEPARSVQAVNLAVVIATVVLGTGMAASGILTSPILAMSIAAVIPALIGAAIGNRLRALLPAESFRTIALSVLLAMGLGLLIRI
ncbi:MAG: hypothetical protein CTY20_01860 [Hyphomicrobium sp.]|nr:MAG: hypothetical protein CTY20_01860 [Hyphomicrobium sp.]